MAQTNVQVLQSDLQAIAKTCQDLAAQILKFARHIGAFQASDMDLLNDDGRWDFDRDDYTTVITWLMGSPAAADLQRKSNESWPRYAARLSKYVGWQMDTDTLRRRYNSRLEQKKVANSRK